MTCRLGLFLLPPQYTRNQRIQQLSPFEVDILGPLFRNIGEKFKHKFEVRNAARRHTLCTLTALTLQDNFWDVAPPVIFFISLVYFVKWKRSDMLYHHRD